MQYEKVRNCPFAGKCATYCDPLVDDARKGADGLGCVGRSDVYRSRHCKGFACKYLSVVLSEVVRLRGRASQAP